MTTQTVIRCLDLLFTLCGSAGFVLSDTASSFSSLEFKAYLSQRGIASNKCSQYINHPKTARSKKWFKLSGRPFS